MDVPARRALTRRDVPVRSAPPVTDATVEWRENRFCRNRAGIPALTRQNRLVSKSSVVLEPQARRYELKRPSLQAPRCSSPHGWRTQRSPEPPHPDPAEAMRDRRPECSCSLGGQLRVATDIANPELIRKILDHVNSRAPPRLTLSRTEPHLNPSICSPSADQPAVTGGKKNKKARHVDPMPASQKSFGYYWLSLHCFM